MKTSVKAVNTDTGEIIDNPMILSGEPVKEPSERNRAREDRDFVKLYRRFIQQISDLGISNPTALRVLLFLIRHMDGTNAIGVQQTLIAAKTGLVRQTVSKAINYLHENGWIAIYKLGRSNIYVINPEVVWTSYADQKAYCRFNCSLMLSRDDQWDISSEHNVKVKYLDPDIIKKMAVAEFPEAEDQAHAAEA